MPRETGAAARRTGRDRNDVRLGWGVSHAPRPRWSTASAEQPSLSPAQRPLRSHINTRRARPSRQQAPGVLAMSPLPISFYYRGIPPTFQWPVKFCLSNSVAAFVLGVITGNVSQVDRVWTFLPTIYAAYYAFLPLWPTNPPFPLFPHVPELVNPAIVESFSPRALLMFSLIVSWLICKGTQELIMSSSLGCAGAGPSPPLVLDLSRSYLSSLTYNTWRRGLFNL